MRRPLAFALLLTLFGCGGTSPGPAHDAGPGDSGGRNGMAQATLSGAQSRSWDYTDSHSLSGNYVSCTSDGSGFFGINAYDFAGGSNGYFIAIHGFHGAGSYPFTYGAAGYTDLSARVDVGSYNYSFTISSGSSVPATCTLTFDASTTTTHATGTISCGALPAGITSPDYVSGGPEPTLTLTSSFDCDL